MTTHDPKTFDIGDWLGDDDPDSYRAKRTVEVYVVRPGLSDEIDQLRNEHAKYTAALETAKRTKGERSVADAGPAVFEARLADIEKRMERAMEKVQDCKRTLEVLRLIQPESEAALATVGEQASSYDKTVALLSAACRVDGQTLSVQALHRLHLAVGDGQWRKIVEAYNEVTHGDPWGGVTAPF